MSYKNFNKGESWAPTNTEGSRELNEADDAEK